MRRAASALTCGVLQLRAASRGQHLAQHDNVALQLRRARRGGNQVRIRRAR
jgi:hypothetical protein